MLEERESNEKEPLPWLVACRRAVRETPRYNAPNPSSRTIVYTACPALRYRGVSRGSANECCCACRRILTTSIGVTTAIASVVPAPRPAVPPIVSYGDYGGWERVLYRQRSLQHLFSLFSYPLANVCTFRSSRTVWPFWARSRIRRLPDPCIGQGASRA